MTSYVHVIPYKVQQERLLGTRFEVARARWINIQGVGHVTVAGGAAGCAPRPGAAAAGPAALQAAQ